MKWIFNMHLFLFITSLWILSFLNESIICGINVENKEWEIKPSEHLHDGHWCGIWGNVKLEGGLSAFYNSWLVNLNLKKNNDFPIQNFIFSFTFKSSNFDQIVAKISNSSKIIQPPKLTNSTTKIPHLKTHI